MGEESFCDTELSLRVGSSVDYDKLSSIASHDRFSSSHDTTMEQQQQQSMTIVYGDRMCVCDVTDIQARAIISLAQKIEMGQSMELNENTDSNNKIINSPSGQLVSSSPSPPPTPAAQFQCPRLSMKRSLQRFLEKRNSRLDGAAPFLPMRHRVPISHR